MARRVRPSPRPVQPPALHSRKAAQQQRGAQHAVPHVITDVAATLGGCGGYTRVVRGSGWVPVGFTVFKTDGGRPTASSVGSTPMHSRQSRFRMPVSRCAGRCRSLGLLFYDRLADLIFPRSTPVLLRRTHGGKGACYDLDDERADMSRMRDYLVSPCWPQAPAAMADPDNPL